MEGSPLRIEALLQGMDGSGDAAAAAALGGVITGILVAIVLLAVAVAKMARSVLRLDSHEYAVEMPAGEPRGLLQLLRL